MSERPFIVLWRDALVESGELTSIAKLVGLTRSLAMGSDGRGCTRSNETIARQSSLSEKSVRNGDKELVANLWLRQRRRSRRTSIFDAFIPDRHVVPIIATPGRHEVPNTAVRPVPRTDEVEAKDQLDVAGFDPLVMDLLPAADSQLAEWRVAFIDDRGGFEQCVREVRAARAAGKLYQPPAALLTSFVRAGAHRVASKQTLPVEAGGTWMRHVGWRFTEDDQREHLRDMGVVDELEVRRLLQLGTTLLQESLDVDTREAGLADGG